MSEDKKEYYIHAVFVVGIVLKAFNGLIETIGGVLFLATGSVMSIITYIVQQELLEDPKDIIANYAQHLLPLLSIHTELFIAIYLLVHGIIKIFLVIGLLMNKLWAYKLSIVVFILFIIYQLYRYSFSHSPFLLVLSLFDVIIIGLTWHEYTYLKKRNS